jgi:dCMP deaminase
LKDKYIEALLDMAERFGQTSEAVRLKVGCLIYKNDSIISMGVNGQPEGWPSEFCEGEDGKTLPTVRHAEDAALQKLCRSTETSVGSVMFISHAPCLPCAIKIATAKISAVYYRYDYRLSDGIDYLRSKGILVEKCSD